MARRNGDARHRMRPLEGERAIVTGGARGIGRGLAEELSANGAEVVIADLASTEAAMALACDEIARRGGHASYVAMDLGDIQSIANGVEQVMSDHRKVDILVNNAGI